MASTIHHTPLVLGYARALIELASDAGQDVAVGAELAAIGQLLAENRSLRLFLADPGISAEERTGLLNRVLAGQASKLVSDFLGVVSLKGRLRDLAGICAAYEELLDQKHGKVEVDVTVAHKLSPEELEEVRQGVSRALKRDAVMHQYVDESIIGGLVVRVGDRLIDGSVKAQLDRMRQNLLASNK